MAMNRNCQVLSVSIALAASRLRLLAKARAFNQTHRRNVQDEKERLKVIKDAEMRYVQIWERTRREQNMLRYQLEMDEWQETLKDYHVRERNEDRVNGELTRYLTRRVAVSVFNFNFPLGINMPYILLASRFVSRVFKS